MFSRPIIANIVFWYKKNKNTSYYADIPSPPIKLRKEVHVLISESNQENFRLKVIFRLGERVFF